MNENDENQINHYLTFKLGDETFASHVNNILKILEMQKITEVPKSPEFMKGVINLRGNVLPIIDARLKFGIKPMPYTDKTCILVLSIIIEKESVEVGAIVDAVMDVIEFQRDNIKPSPSLGSKYKSDFIDGVMKIDDKFIMVLNMDSVFSTNEIIDLKDTANIPENKNGLQNNDIEN
ncbi:MAG: chemotaxis protein CheW [Bacteroidales bacterium]|nr:chemotaxis protein CheW [Bacteroidales bacterium]